MIDNCIQSGLPLGVITGLFVVGGGILGRKAKECFAAGRTSEGLCLIRSLLFNLILFFIILIVKDVGKPFIALILDFTFLIITIIVLVKASCYAR
ncbi:MAG: hypothetical protein WHS44_08855 [Fimbriimonadales bacterium]